MRSLFSVCYLYSVGLYFSTGIDVWDTSTKSLAELLDKELGDILQPSFSMEQQAGVSLDGSSLSADHAIESNYRLTSQLPSSPGTRLRRKLVLRNYKVSA